MSEKLLIPIKLKKSIDKFKSEYKKRIKKEDKAFLKLCERLGIESESPTGINFWDYLYNDSDWLVEYSDKRK